MCSEDQRTVSEDLKENRGTMSYQVDTISYEIKIIKKNQRGNQKVKITITDMKN